MKGFKFKLENILVVKEKIEKDRKNRFAFALQTLDKEKTRLEELIFERSKTISEFEEKASKGMFAWESIIYNKGIEKLNKLIHNQKQRIQDAENLVEQAKEAMMKAQIERKSFEKMKEKDKKSFDYKLSKEEEKLYDQISSFNYVNKTE